MFRSGISKRKYKLMKSLSPVYSKSAYLIALILLMLSLIRFGAYPLLVITILLEPFAIIRIAKERMTVAIYLEALVFTVFLCLCMFALSEIVLK